MLSLCGGRRRPLTAVAAAAALGANASGITNGGVLGKAVAKALGIGLGTLKGGGDNGGNGFQIQDVSRLGIDVQDVAVFGVDGIGGGDGLLMS